MIVQLVLAFAAGAALAAFYLGGLWWFTRRLTSAARPGLWLAVGSAVRLALTLTGFLGIAGFGPAALATALAGFVLVRITATRRVAALAQG